MRCVKLLHPLLLVGVINIFGLILVLTPMCKAQDSGIVSSLDMPPSHQDMYSVYLGYGRSFWNTDVKTIAEDCICPEFGSATDRALVLGVVSALPIHHINKNTNLYFSYQLGMSFQSANFTTPGDSLPSIDPDGNIIHSSTQFAMPVNFNAFSLSLGIGIQSDFIGFDVSGVAALGIKPDSKRLFQLISPENAEADPSLFPGRDISEDGRTVTLETYGPESHASVLYGVQFAPRLMHDFGRLHLELVPTYTIYFNSVHTFGTTNLQVLTLNIRAGVLL